MDLRMDAQYDGMEFFLTTPQQSDNSYEEKRKYLKRRSHETDEPPANKKTMADVTPMVNILPLKMGVILYVPSILICYI
jgi:hypothetical protein